MNCPRCTSAALVELDRDGITLDRCERCRGIWLDRGELEKLLAAARHDDDRAHAAPDPRVDPRVASDFRRDDSDEHDYRHRGPGGHKRKRSWLDIFDID